MVFLSGYVQFVFASVRTMIHIMNHIQYVLSCEVPDNASSSFS
jgi:hypothetical protein